MDTSVVKFWHQIVQTRNSNQLNEILHDHVVFYSPVVHTPQVGKKITIQYLSAAFKVFFDDSFTYVRKPDRFKAIASGRCLVPKPSFGIKCKLL